MAKSRRRSLSDGMALVTAYKKSGQTQGQFAKAHGVAVSTLQYWLAQTKRRATDKTAVRFVEVVGRSSHEQSGESSGMVMDLSSGIRLRFDTLPSPEYLVSVAMAFARSEGC